MRDELAMSRGCGHAEAWPRSIQLNAMEINSHRYLIGLTAEDGSALGQFPAVVDWEPAMEWARHGALRRWLDPMRAAEALIRLEPVWHAESGAPYVGSLRVTAESEGVAPASAEIPLLYFKPVAVRASLELVEQKKLAPGAAFNFSVTAYPNLPETARRSGNDLEFEELAIPVTLKSSSLREFMAKSEPFANPEAEDMPVFVPQTVLDEVTARTEEAGAVEAGSILIGHLHCDHESKEVFLEVTEQIPALHTVAESTKICFTRETWAAADAAIALRRKLEIYCGWQHSHPGQHWCNPNCPPDARQRCPLTRSFFSTEDVALHRIIFPKSFSIALVVTNAPAGMRIAMYAWNKGMVAPRGFHIINANGSAQPPLPAESTANPGEHNHETSCPT